MYRFYIYIHIYIYILYDMIRRDVTCLVRDTVAVPC